MVYRIVVVCSVVVSLTLTPSLSAAEEPLLSPRAVLEKALQAIKDTGKIDAIFPYTDFDAVYDTMSEEDRAFTKSSNGTELKKYYEAIHSDIHDRIEVIDVDNLIPKGHDFTPEQRQELAKRLPQLKDMAHGAAREANDRITHCNFTVLELEEKERDSTGKIRCVSGEKEAIAGVRLSKREGTWRIASLQFIGDIIAQMIGAPQKKASAKST